MHASFRFMMFSPIQRHHMRSARSSPLKQGRVSHIIRGQPFLELNNFGEMFGIDRTLVSKVAGAKDRTERIVNNSHSEIRGRIHPRQHHFRYFVLEWFGCSPNDFLMRWHQGLCSNYTFSLNPICPFFRPGDTAYH